MSEDNQELLKIFDSAEFDAFQCIDYIRLNTENIGIHQYLVKKLRTCKYDELEFMIPQLVQLLVAFETESMALEDLLIDYSKLYPHFSLIVFWSLQAYVFELRNDPESYSFQTLRRFINKLQGIIFNAELTSTQPPKSFEFRENLKPSLVLCGVAAASMVLPQINEYASPLIISQGRQQKSFVFKLANFQKALTKNLTLKNQRISTEVNALAASDDETLPMHHSADISRVVTSRPPNDLQRSSSLSRLPSSRKISTSLMQLSDGDSEVTDDDSFSLERHALGNHEAFSKIEKSLNINTVIKSKKSLRKSLVKGDLVNSEANRSSYGTGTTSLGFQSMPDLTHNDEVSIISPYLSPAESDSSIFQHGGSIDNDNKKQFSRTASKSSIDAFQLLRINYAKKETDFIMSLQNISLRLSQVPKQARLSALRAELSIINRNDLPSQIDIPQLLPVTSNKNKKYHKILKLNVNEACVLNSAERVPFLLLIEYLSDEMDFNPYSDENQQILQANAKMSEGTFGLRTAVETVSGSKRNSLDDMGITRPIDYGEADLSDMKTVYEKSIINLTSRSSTPNHSGLILQSRLELPAIPLENPDITTKVLADQMRIASVMLQQLESSGLSSSEQALAIKKRIVESMQSLQNQFDSIDYEKIVQLGGNIHNAGERKLENDVKLGEDWNAKKIRIRKSSVYGHLRNWELCSVIVKNGDDLPQEAFACQLITMISNIWKSKGIDAWTKRMKILITSANAGLVETITNAISIHSIKKSLTEISISQGDNLKGRIFTLSDYFERLYGNRESFRFRQAQNNFASSLASYSIICYILQIKDRHNGNIMLDDEGHIIHIDFGFLLSNSPGSLGFEGAPFKLTTEYVEVLGGIDSPAFQKFKNVCKACFSELRKNSDQIINMVELMQKDSSLPCFKNGENTSVLLKQRFQLQLTDEESDLYVENALIGKSLGSVYTRLYDQFQMITQGIYS